MDKYWLESAVAGIIDKIPEGEIIVSSGVTPSGPYHIGHLREVLTADAITIGLKKADREARHLHFVDDFDGFKKVPAGIDESFEQYLRTPYYMTSSPGGEEGSFADYYFNIFKGVMDELQVDMEIIRAHEVYNEGRFSEAIEQSLENTEKVRELIEEISHRQLPKAWSPIQVFEDNKLYKHQFVSIDKESKTLVFRREDGSEGETKYDDGKVKLDWRLDWPARWAIWKVQVEPFGRDHATKGGSYDTGKALVSQIFNSDAPIPYPYEFINRAGETKKMSASSGNVITPEQSIELMPPELLRYFVLKSRPGLTLYYGTGHEYGRLFDEFKQLTVTDKLDAAHIATHGRTEPVLSDVPFVHLVTAWQSASRVVEKAIDIISRSEHKDKIETQRELIEKEFSYINKWLDIWAPDEVKFEIQDTLPQVELTDIQKQALDSIATKVESASEESDGQWFHERVYEVKDELDIQPKELFTAIYRAILGQDNGPKAGWFLSTIEKDWLIKRLRLEA